VQLTLFSFFSRWIIKNSTVSGHIRTAPETAQHYTLFFSNYKVQQCMILSTLSKNRTDCCSSPACLSRRTNLPFRELLARIRLYFSGLILTIYMPAGLCFFFMEVSDLQGNLGPRIQ
jgi:hypothetical protein